MKNLLTALSVAIICATVSPAFAEHNEMHKMSAEYQKIDDKARSTLNECLQDSNMTTKQCMKKTKKQLKKLKKEYKKELSRKIMNKEVEKTE